MPKSSTRYARRHAWKRSWQRFECAAEELPSALEERFPLPDGLLALRVLDATNGRARTVDETDKRAS
eukprot:605538-Pyramimonas_sp.AAC.1